MIKLTGTATLLTLLLGSTAALAQGAPTHPLMALDVDKSGTISTEEALQAKRPELLRLDVNQDGQLSQDELPRGAAPKELNTPKEAPPRGLLAYFKSMDSNGDGNLDRQEFGRGFAGKDEQFDKLDRNKDGLLAPAELAPKKPAGANPPSKTP